MKTKKLKKWRFSSLLPLLIFAIIIAFLARGLYLNPRHIPSNKINKPAPNFNLQRLYSEQHFSPQQLLGKKWLLNVWASWCPACQLEHPLLNQLAKNSNITLVGLNYKDTNQAAKQWLVQKGNPYQYIAIDKTGDVGIDYGVYGTPETFIIDEKGTIIYKHVGPLSSKIINTQVLPLLLDTNQ